MSYPEAMSKSCAHCGNPIPANADPRRIYCTPKCKKRSNHLDASRGQEALAYLQVWLSLKNAKSAADKELRAYAMRELCYLGRRYNADDAAIGRDAAKLIRPRLERGERLFDKEERKVPKDDGVVCPQRLAA